MDAREYDCNCGVCSASIPTGVLKIYNVTNPEVETSKTEDLYLGFLEDIYDRVGLNYTMKIFPNNVLYHNGYAYLIENCSGRRYSIELNDHKLLNGDFICPDCFNRMNPQLDTGTLCDMCGTKYESLSYGYGCNFGGIDCHTHNEVDGNVLRNEYISPSYGSKFDADYLFWSNLVPNKRGLYRHVKPKRYRQMSMFCDNCLRRLIDSKELIRVSFDLDSDTDDPG